MIQSWPKIKFIANKQKEIAEVYNRFGLLSKEEKYKLNTSGNKDFGKIAEDIFEAKSKLEILNHSWYDIASPDTCAQWHIDHMGEWSMLISSYDSTTQIAIPLTKQAKELVYYKDKFGCTHRTEITKKIEELIQINEFEIFTPELGDIYWLDRAVIHRINPASYGKPRLCLRMWEPKGY